MVFHEKVNIKSDNGIDMKVGLRSCRWNNFHPKFLCEVGGEVVNSRQAGCRGFEVGRRAGDAIRASLNGAATKADRAEERKLWRLVSRHQTTIAKTCFLKGWWKHVVGEGRCDGGGG